MKHTIIGAGGAIGNVLTKKLLENNQQVRLVSRSGFSADGTEAKKADVTNPDEMREAVKDSDVVYLLVGLQYNIDIWRETWPVIMNNAIEACKEAEAKLIFFDNVYMYGKVDGKMTEETPYNPCSKKGEIRAEIARMLESEFKKNDLNAIIARSADFYGPYASKSSIPYILAVSKLLHGKKAQWMVDANLPHSLTYTPDCANALYMLANDDSAFNQIWHLPTFNPAISGKTFMELAAKEIGVDLKYTVLKKYMLKLGGLFDKPVKELYEMTYQNEFEYYFDSTKFNKNYDYSPKPYPEGIKETIEWAKKNIKE